MFRDLRADEIECRVAQAKQTGVSLLLYKDARCDQNILDETVGAMNWQRSHLRDNANCVVSIWDETKQQWISKEDTGTESNTEKEKGLASDSFKRACFNWGIGRELYTAPFIWISAQNCETLKPNGQKWSCYDTFSVASIKIVNKRIEALTIINGKNGEICYRFPANRQKEATDTKKATPSAKAALPKENPESKKNESVAEKRILELKSLGKDELDYFDAYKKLKANGETALQLANVPYLPEAKYREVFNQIKLQMQNDLTLKEAV